LIGGENGKRSSVTKPHTPIGITEVSRYANLHLGKMRIGTIVEDS